MTTFRITLIILGALLVVAIYFYNRHLVNKASKAVLDADHSKPEIRNEPVWDDEVAESSVKEDGNEQVNKPDINLSMLSDLVREAAKESGRHSSRATAQQNLADGEKPCITKIESERPSLLLNGNLLIIHLLAKNDEEFYGQDLLDVFTDNNIHFGSMDIFHYYSDETDQTLFSVVNIVKPGHFNLAEMGSFTTPGISFFMQLDALDYPVRSFEIMLKGIWNIAEALNARICDMNHSSLTPQTATFLHEEVKNYQNTFNRR